MGKPIGVKKKASLVGCLAFASWTLPPAIREHKYTDIKIPCLAFFAVPHDLSRAFPGDAARHAAVVAADLDRQTRLANAFEAGVPSAKVIRLPNANHYIFRSNEAEVFRAMNDFLDKLPQP
jgi:alpha-beta hydrolase superfamily lysophospholipase